MYFGSISWQGERGRRYGAKAALWAAALMLGAAAPPAPPQATATPANTASPAPAPAKPVSSPPASASPSPNPSPARGQVAVRVGRHPGYTRLVFDRPQDGEVDHQQQDRRLILTMPGAGNVEGLRSLPPGVAGFKNGSDSAEIQLTPDATAQVSHIDHRVVVDVFFGAAAKANAPVKTAPEQAAGKGSATDQPATKPPAAPPAPPKAARLAHNEPPLDYQLVPVTEPPIKLPAPAPAAPTPTPTPTASSAPGAKLTAQSTAAPESKPDSKLAVAAPPAATPLVPVPARLPAPTAQIGNAPTAQKGNLPTAQMGNSPTMAPSGAVPVAQTGASPAAQTASLWPLPPMVQIARAKAKQAEADAKLAQAAAVAADATKTTKTTKAKAELAEKQPSQPPPTYGPPVPPPAAEAKADSTKSPTTSTTPLDMADGDLGPMNHLGILAATSPAHHVGPMGAMVAAVRLEDTSLGGPAFLLPLGKDVGAAAFMRGGLAHLVFDTGEPIDISPLHDDRIFGAINMAATPDAIELTLPVPSDRMLDLRRRSDGWVAVLVSQQPRLVPIMQKAEDGKLRLHAKQVGDVVVLQDQLTGNRLLVGTQLEDGEAVAASRHLAEFSLLRTFLGVVIAPSSDRILLQPLKDGFAVQTDRGNQLALAASDDTSSLLPGAAMSRYYDFPDLPVVSLRARFAAAKIDAASAPLLARAAPRMHMAETLVALGMGQEAEAALDMAVAQEPGLASDPWQRGLHAIANFLADRPVDNSAFDQVGVGNSDEVTLWRALTAADPQDPAARAGLAQTWPLILTYPQSLRERLLPMVADRLIAAHDRNSLQAFLASVDQLPTPPVNMTYAHAMSAEMSGDLNRAANLLRSAGRERDRFYAAKARRDLVSLELVQNKISPGDAAERLDALFYAWRGDQDELENRLMVAKFNIDRHAWRQSLGVLREAEGLYPQDMDRIKQAEHSVIAALAAGSNARQVSAFDLVSLLDDNADLLSMDPNAAQFTPVLLDKLMALDLPSRAAPILRHMLAMASNPALRADLGGKLAAVTLDQGDGKNALAILDATESPQATPDVQDERVRIRANTLAINGDLAGARTALAGTTSLTSLDLRARLEMRAQDWAAARQTLTNVVARTVPASGDIAPAAQDNILRLAAATAQAGDTTGVQKLQGDYGSRLATGPRTELFDLLTEKPVYTATDLPRAATELSTAKAAVASLTTPDATTGQGK